MIFALLQIQNADGWEESADDKEDLGPEPRLAEEDQKMS